MKSTLVAPLITEKSLALANRNWYTFIVDRLSRKSEISGVVESQFKVHVMQIKTIVMKGKSQRSGKKRLFTHTPPWKKAMVKLKDQEKIDLFTVEGTTQGNK